MAAVLKLVSFPVYLGCYALHDGIMYVSILYTLYNLFRLCANVCLRISVMQKKKKKKKKKKKSALNRTFSTESHINWRKSINMLKNNGLFLKNKK